MLYNESLLTDSQGRQAVMALYGVLLYFENPIPLKFQVVTLCEIHQSRTEVTVPHDCLVGSVHSKRKWCKGLMASCIRNFIKICRFFQKLITCVEINYPSLSRHNKDARLEKPALVQMVSKVFSLHCLIYVAVFVNTKLDSACGTIRRAFNWA
jgi:hypothetical protein